MVKRKIKDGKANKKENIFGILSFIFGIFGGVSFFITGFYYILIPIFSLVGIVFAAIQRKKSKSIFATIGFVLNTIALIILLILTIISFYLINKHY